MSAHGYFDFSADQGDELREALSEYKRNLDLAAEQVERFNSALPYLLSVIIQDRMEAMSKLPRPEGELTEERSTKADFHESLAKLVAEGRIIVSQGADARTGESWTRYFAAGHGPEIN